MGAGCRIAIHRSDPGESVWGPVTYMSWVQQAYLVCAYSAAAPLSALAGMDVEGAGSAGQKREAEERALAVEPGAVGRALRTLSNLAHQPAISPLMLSAFVECIVTSLRPFLEGDERVEIEWCRCLGALARRDSNARNAIFHAGGISGLLGLMRSTVSEAGHRPDVVLQHACAALGHLCTENPWNCVAVREARGVRAVVLAMHFHPPGAALQANASLALANLALADAKAREDIVEVDGVPRVVGALRLHPTDARVQLQVRPCVCVCVCVCVRVCGGATRTPTCRKGI